MATDILLNRYHVVERLGEGAMGAVWLVEDGAAGARLAMKVLGKAMGDGPAAKLQLKQEFRVMTQLRHPNCCAVYDYGQLPDGAPFFTMELVPGRGLDAALPLGPDEWREVLVQLALALGHVHQLGYVHMDVKPENVRLRPDGVLKLMDYGLMEPAGRAGGAIKGTLGYLAPEVVKRGPVDARADLYALGAVAYELWTGQTPFVRPTPLDVLRAHVQDAPEPPSQLRPGLPPEWERLILKLLAKDPLARCQSAAEVILALGAQPPEGLGGSLLASPVVGREACLGQLQEALTELAKFGAPGPVWLEGPPGVGKTRLVEEVRYLAQLEDVAVAAGAPPAGPVPFGAIAALLGELIPLARTHAPEVLERLAPVLVKLRPELAVAPASELDPPAREKLRLVDAVAELALAVAQALPLVLVLEDWQRADALAAEALDHLLRNAGEATLLVVVASREGPPDSARWAQRVRRLQVEPLDPAALWKMLSSMLGSSDLDAGFVKQVAEWSARVPRDVERLLDHLVRHGVLARRPDGQWVTAIHIPADAVPRGLDGLAMAKLEGLGAGAVALARAAAVAGEGARLDDFASILAWGEEALLDAASELDRAGVLVPGDDGQWHFVDERLAELLVEGMPSEDRLRAQSLLVSKLLAELGAPEAAPSERLRALVRHALAGQGPVAALPYVLESARRSVRLFSAAAARTALEAGLPLVPAGDESLRLAFVAELGDVLRTLAPKEAIPRLEEAAALAEAQGEWGRLGPMLTSLAKAHQMATQYEEAVAAVARSAEVLTRVGDQAGLARCLLTQGRLLFFRGRREEAAQAANEAVVAAEKAGEAPVRGTAYALAGYFAVAGGDPELLGPGVRSLDEALVLLQEAGDKLGLMNALNLLGNARNAMGLPLLSQASFEQTLVIAREVGSGDDEVVALINLATTALELGQPLVAREHARNAQSLAQSRNTGYAVSLAMILEAAAAVAMGELGGARARAEEALEAVVRINNPYVEVLVRIQQVELLLALGDAPAAHDAANLLHALMEKTGNREPALRLNVAQAELLGRAGAFDEARARAQAALDEALRSSSEAGALRGRLALARVALAAGAWAEADRRLQEATEQAEALGMKGLSTLAWLLRGDWALMMGRAAARQAHAAYQKASTQAAQARLLSHASWASFGLAATQPEAPAASALVERAWDELSGMAQQLPEAEREAFWSPLERARIHDRAHRELALPLALSDRAAASALRFAKLSPAWWFGAS